MHSGMKINTYKKDIYFPWFSHYTESHLIREEQESEPGYTEKKILQGNVLLDEVGEQMEEEETEIE